MRAEGIADRLRDPRRWSTLQIVLRDVGSLQVLLGSVMLLPLLVALLYGETYSAASFLTAGVISAGCGAGASRLFRNAPEPDRHHAMMIAGAGWLVTAMFGSLPFLIAAYVTPMEVAQAFVPRGETYTSSLFFFRNPLHALFESMSAFTTTGLTMAVHEPSIGRGLLFYRSLGQWIGGVGVIVLSLAILPRPRAVGGLDLYQSETAVMKLRPTILGTARSIWKIYGALTAFLIVYVFAATLLILPDRSVETAFFEAVNHAMAGLATGGFSPLDDSIAGYRSAAMEMVLLLPMILGVIALPLHYAVFRQRQFGMLWGDPQVRLMVLLFALVIPTLTLTLLDTEAVVTPVRDATFQVVSALSGTGWQTADFRTWRASSLLLLAGGTMIVGGAAGSTAGGFKLIRAYVLLRAVGWRISKIFMPAHAVLPFRLGPKRLPALTMTREVADAAVMSYLYLAVLGVCLVVVSHFAPPGFTDAEVIFESISAQGTVGLSTGITDPGMPTIVEIVFIIQMWVGRLEIFPVLVLVRAVAGWLGRR